MFLALAACFLFSSRPARAVEISVQILTGFSTLNLSAGSTYLNKDGGIGFEARPEIDLDWPSLNGGVDFFYQGRFGSNFGSFPLSREGLGIFYYPFGLPIHKVIMDNGVTVNENTFAAYVDAQITLTTVAVTDPTQVPTLSFNGLAIGWQLGGGTVIPMGSSWGLVLGFIVDSTLLGGATSGSVSYFDFGAMLGITLHP